MTYSLYRHCHLILKNTMPMLKLMNEQVQMATTIVDHDVLVSNIVKKVAAYDIRNWGPYPETKEGFKRAAVLLPITISNGEVFILLTKRSKNLRSNPSMMVFPGGIREETDSSDVETALREAHEEIGLPPSEVQILGILTRGILQPNTVVYPVVGLIPSSFVPSVNPSEVEFAFYMPLNDFITEENVTYYIYNIRGQPIIYNSVNYSNEDVTANIYGFTATFCILLAKIIFDKTDCLIMFKDTKEKLSSGLYDAKEKQSLGLYDDLIRYFEFITSTFEVKSNL